MHNNFKGSCSLHWKKASCTKAWVTWLHPPLQFIKYMEKEPATGVSGEGKDTCLPVPRSCLASGLSCHIFAERWLIDEKQLMG